MQRTPWFNRQFPVIEDNGILPAIIERLAGTPARVDLITSGLPNQLLTAKLDGKWSIKEEIGHLGDLEPLWSSRLDDLIKNIPELTVADLSNRRTHQADHNAIALTVLCDNLRSQRLQLVNKLTGLGEEQLRHSALHPRLRTPMRIIDLAYFVAEHDDHHLAGIRQIITTGC